MAAQGHEPKITPVVPVTVALPDVLAAIDLVLEASERLERVRGPLAQRAERNLARSRRARANKTMLPIGSNGHAHDADVRLVITHHGLARECVRCGKRVAS